MQWLGSLAAIVSAPFLLGQKINPVNPVSVAVLMIEGILIMDEGIDDHTDGNANDKAHQVDG